MRLVPTLEQTMLRDSLSRLLQRTYSFERRRALVSAAPTGSDPATWRHLADLGAMSVRLPVEAGGLGGGGVEQAIIMEELGRFLVVEPYWQTMLGADLLLACRADPALLGAMASGEHRVVFVAPDPPVTLYAEQAGPGYRITGSCRSVAGAPSATMVLAVAQLRSDRGGVALFQVPAGTPGLTQRPFRTIDGGAGADLTFNGVQAGSDSLIGCGSQLAAAIEAATDTACVMLGAEAVGICDGVNELTQDYTAVRQQFGKRLDAFQAVQHRLAEMYVETDRLRSTVLAGLAAMDGPPAARRRAASAVKVQIGRSGQFVAGQGIQLHGGMGMVDDYAAGQFYKRMVALDLTLGTASHHLERYSKNMVE